MTDLVKRLREMGVEDTATEDAFDILSEAADRIEELQITIAKRDQRLQNMETAFHIRETAFHIRLEENETLQARVKELEAVLERLGDENWITNPKKKGAKPENIHISRWFHEWDARIQYARDNMEPPE